MACSLCRRRQTANSFLRIIYSWILCNLGCWSAGLLLMAAGPPKLYRAYSVRSKIRAWTCFTAKLCKIPWLIFCRAWELWHPQALRIYAKYTTRWWSLGSICLHFLHLFQLPVLWQGFNGPPTHLIQGLHTSPWQLLGSSADCVGWAGHLTIFTVSNSFAHIIHAFAAMYWMC